MPRKEKPIINGLLECVGWKGDQHWQDVSDFYCRPDGRRYATCRACTKKRGRLRTMRTKLGISTVRVEVKTSIHIPNSPVARLLMRKW